MGDPLLPPPGNRHPPIQASEGPHIIHIAKDPIAAPTSRSARTVRRRSSKRKHGRSIAAKWSWTKITVGGNCRIQDTNRYFIFRSGISLYTSLYISLYPYLFGSFQNGIQTIDPRRNPINKKGEYFYKKTLYAEEIETRTVVTIGGGCAVYGQWNMFFKFGLEKSKHLEEAFIGRCPIKPYRSKRTPQWGTT